MERGNIRSAGNRYDISHYNPPLWRSQKGSRLYTKDITHIVNAGLLADDPSRRPNGAGGEIIPRRRPVCYFNPLALAEKVDRMLTRHISPSQGLHTDGPLRPFSSLPFPMEHGVSRVISPQGPRQDLPHSHGGARGGVDLLIMMGFENLDVIPIAQKARRLFNQPKSRVDTHAHVGGMDTRDFLSKPRQRLALGRREPRGPDDDAHPFFGGKAGMGQTRFWNGERNNNIPFEGGRIGGEWNPQRADPRRLTGIIAQTGKPVPLKGAR